MFVDLVIVIVRVKLLQFDLVIVVVIVTTRSLITDNDDDDDVLRLSVCLFAEIPPNDKRISSEIFGRLGRGPRIAK